MINISAQKMDEKQKWLLASTALNLLFSLAKLWVGWKLGSTLVSADGIHSLSDVFGSFLILVALRIASRSFSLFPIGLNKLEDLAVLILKHVDEVIFGGEHNDLVMLLDALGIVVKKPVSSKPINDKQLSFV